MAQTALLVALVVREALVVLFQVPRAPRATEDQVRRVALVETEDLLRAVA